MSDDKFSNAGKAFRNQQARDFSACDQALARLSDIQITCQTGVEAFYSAAGLGRPDVYVERPTEQRLHIAYGFRPGPKQNSVVVGPVATIAVMADGTTILGSNLSWTPLGAGAVPIDIIPLELEDWQASLSDWLVDFLTESERAYRELHD
jgi:hypothetical protein